MNRYKVSVMYKNMDVHNSYITTDCPKKAIRSIVHYIHGYPQESIVWKDWLCLGRSVKAGFYFNDKGVIRVDCRRVL